MGKVTKKDTVSVAKLAELQALASNVVSKISDQELVNQVAAAASLSPQEAANLLKSTKLEEEIHRQLCDKIVNGSLAIKAIEALQAKVAEGNMQAIQLVIAFNKHLRPQAVNAVRDIHISNDKAIVAIGEEAQRLLGEKTRT